MAQLQCSADIVPDELPVSGAVGNAKAAVVAPRCKKMEYHA